MSHALHPDLQPDLQPHEPLTTPSRGDNVTFLILCCAGFLFAVVMMLGAGV